MPKYEFLPATWAHAEELAEHIRPADEAEVWATNHQTPITAVANCIAWTPEPKTICADSQVVCLFGVAENGSILSTTGVPWMLTTENAPKHDSYLLRQSQTHVSQMKRRYNRLENYVDARNSRALRWLGWLGFEIHPAAPFGVDSLPFHLFTWDARYV